MAVPTAIQLVKQIILVKIATLYVFSKLAYANNNSICNSFVPMVAPAIHAMGMENAFKANANATRDGSATNILTV